jgi:hypothetical protein
MQTISTFALLVLSATSTLFSGGAQRQLATVDVLAFDQPGMESAAEAAAVARDWIAKTTDSICGLKDTNQVSNPALIDFQACLDATPQMKKLKDNKIDPNSPEGIKLTTEAANKVTAACETLRIANGYCSVWKTIRHKDGRTVADITDLVKAQF